VELGRYLCEVRPANALEAEDLEILSRISGEEVPESRGKAYYLMSIHEHLPPQARKDLKKVDGRRDWN
jgi:hypothetical protein